MYSKKSFITICLILSLIVLEGKILVKGNHPFAELFLVTRNQQHYIIKGFYRQELWDRYQGKLVKIKGDLKKLDLIPGPAGELRAIEIMEVSKKRAE